MVVMGHRERPPWLMVSLKNETNPWNAASVLSVLTRWTRLFYGVCICSRWSVCSVSLWAVLWLGLAPDSLPLLLWGFAQQISTELLTIPPDWQLSSGWKQTQGKGKKKKAFRNGFRCQLWPCAPALWNALEWSLGVRCLLLSLKLDCVVLLGSWILLIGQKVSLEQQLWL